MRRIGTMTQEKNGEGPALESQQEFTFVDDGFQRLWTPHRMVYINGERPTDHAGEGCTTCARFLARRVLAGQSVSVSPWQGLDLAELGLTPHQCRAAVQWVGHGGQ